MYAAPLYNEKDLLSLMAGGDSAAFDAIYKHYSTSIYDFLLRYTKVPELAEDLSQEIFCKIWENRGQLPVLDSFRAYLFVVARNHTLNYLNRAVTCNAAMGAIIKQMPVEGTLADDKLLAQEYRDWLQAILDGMQPNMRTVFLLARQEYKTYDEIAEILGISRNTVKKHMIRSVDLIKGKLKTELGISMALFLAISNLK
jgi:RNA polymerase sigma-70 factor (family 1)